MKIPGLASLGALIFGRPATPTPGKDQIRADIIPQPFVGPDQLDNYGCEIPEMRRAYGRLAKSEPAVRSAILGKTASVASLEVTVLPKDKENQWDVLAAKWVNETIDESTGGWDGLIVNIVRPALIYGWSVNEKILKGAETKYGPRWGLRECKSKDTNYLRLQLDVFRNVTGIFSLVRGLEDFDPEKVILFSNMALFENPFGESDLRAAYRSAMLIEDAYKLWHQALGVYSGPFVHGKYGATGQRQQMMDALQQARSAGIIATPVDDEIEVLNLASATSFDAFQAQVDKLREEIFMAVRGAYLPFLEGEGGENAHADTKTHKVASDAIEYLLAKAVGRVITQQLVPDLVYPNFPIGTGLPKVILGGVNWGETKQLLETLKGFQEIGGKISARWAHDTGQIPPPEDPEDELKPVAAPGGGPGGPGAPPPPGGSMGAALPPTPVTPAALPAAQAQVTPEIPPAPQQDKFADDEKHSPYAQKLAFQQVRKTPVPAGPVGDTAKFLAQLFDAANDSMGLPGRHDPGAIAGLIGKLIPQQTQQFAGTPPHPGLVPQSGNVQHPGHWVRPEDMVPTAQPAAAPVQPGQQPQQAQSLGPQAATNVGDVRDHFEQSLGVKLSSKAMGAVQALHERVYGMMYRMDGAIQKCLQILPQIVDTPQDMERLGYNPGLSGMESHVHDPVREHLGIGAYTAAAIASHVLGRAIVAAKRATGYSQNYEMGPLAIFEEPAGPTAPVLGQERIPAEVVPEMPPLPEPMSAATTQAVAPQDEFEAMFAEMLGEFDRMASKTFAEGDPKGHWVTTEEGNRLFVKDGVLHTSPTGQPVKIAKKPPLPDEGFMAGREFDGVGHGLILRG